MRKILITGASGAGTTTLGRALAGHLALPCFDADDFFWHPTSPPYKRLVKPEARLAAILDQLGRHPEWVLSGSVVNWGAALEDLFTLIVWRTVPTDLRIARLIQRSLARFGEPPRPELLAWAARYDAGGLDVRSRALHEKWLSARTCAIVRIDGDLTVAACLARTLAALRAPRPNGGPQET